MARDVPTGIDLGTTNSAMAWVDDSGASAMVANAEGEFITPSVVYFSDAEVVVGKNARTAIVAHPDMVAQWVKRDMGAPFYSHPIRGQYLPPEVIQACILRKIKTDIIRALGPGARTVITVPAYFDELRRKATADAGEMAGLRVLDIVNEPTAAALAFGEALGYLTPGGAARQEMNVLVYDLGGGTFDVTLLRLASADIKTLATDGDVQLGGHDWDERLVRYAADCFQKAHGLDPRQDPATLNRLYQTAMEAKHTLSARSRASIRIDYAERSLDVPVTREQFEEMTADLLERTAYTSRQLLSAAGLHWMNVQRILLVGGSTRMPMVSRMLKQMTGIEPDRTVNPDEAVARGAAIYARYLLAKQSAGGRTDFQVTNVNAHSLGIEGIDTETLRKKNVILIPRNTALPAKHTERFATKSEGQRSIVLKVLEGESSLPGECIAIGRTVVRDLPSGLPKGWPIEVTFEYAANGRLSVDAVVPGTQHRARMELERDVGLSGDGIARWKLPISTAAGFNAFESAMQEVLRTPGLSAAPGAGDGGSGVALDRPPGGPGGLSGATGGLPARAGVGAADTPAQPGGTPALAVPPTLAAMKAGSTPQPATPVARPPYGMEAASTPPRPAAPVPAQFASVPTPFAAEPILPAMPVLDDLSPGAAAPGQAGPWASGPQPLAGPAASTSIPGLTRSDLGQRRPERKRLMPLWLTRLIGHVIAALLGLATAYFLLSWLRPDLFPSAF